MSSDRSGIISGPVELSLRGSRGIWQAMGWCEGERTRLKTERRQPIRLNRGPDYIYFYTFLFEAALLQNDRSDINRVEALSNQPVDIRLVGKEYAHFLLGFWLEYRIDFLFSDKQPLKTLLKARRQARRLSAVYEQNRIQSLNMRSA